jgi:hypothetical protein
MNEYDIVKIFQDIEEILIKSMKRNLSRHLQEELKEELNWSMWQAEKLKELKKYRQEYSKHFERYFSTINEELEELIKQSYESGKLNQENKILKTLKNRKVVNRNKVSSATFFNINDNKINELIKEVMNDFRAAENSILRYANDQYRQIIYKAQVYANSGAGTVTQAIDMATKDFLSKGINSIQYSSGAMVNIASYAEMAIRTANKRAYLYGEGTKRDEWNVYTVLVPNRGRGCPYCVKFQGKIFIDDVFTNGTPPKQNKYPYLSEAMKQRLFHPNCKDGLVTYFEDINTVVEEPTQQEIQEKSKNYILDQKKHYNERQIRKYKRLEMGSIDPNNIEKYRQKRIEWQEYNKKFCKDNNLRRDYNRENPKFTLQNLENRITQLDISNRLKGYAVNNVNISGVSSHLIDQMNERKVLFENIEETLKKPLKFGKIKYNKDNKPSFSVIGEQSTIYVNPETGNITTVHKTHTRTINKIREELKNGKVD